MKKNIVYAFFLTLGMTMSFLPIGGKSIEPNLYNLLEIERGRIQQDVSIEESSFNNDLFESETEKETELFPPISEHIQDIKKGEDETENSVSMENISEEKMTTETESDGLEIDSQGKSSEQAKVPSSSSMENSSAGSTDNTYTESDNDILPERQTIPAQTENTASASQETLDSIRSQVYQYVNRYNGGFIQESSDLKNAAVAKLNGYNGTAMDVLAALGGEGWRSADWQEYSAYEYCLDTSDTVIADVTSTLCGYIGTAFANRGYTNMGAGVLITPDSGCLRVTIEVILTN